MGVPPDAPGWSPAAVAADGAEEASGVAVGPVVVEELGAGVDEEAAGEGEASGSPAMVNAVDPEMGWESALTTR